MDLYGLPTAVTAFLSKMHCESHKHLTYEIHGDGASTTLNLTWSTVASPRCRCTTRIRPTEHGDPTKTHRRWSTGASYSSPVDITMAALERTLIESPEEQWTSSSSTDSSDTELTESDTEDDPASSSDPTSSDRETLEDRLVRIPSTPGELLPTSENITQSCPDPLTEGEVKNNGGVPGKGPGEADGNEVGDLKQSPADDSRTRDKCDQTDDMVRVVKRCHALWAVLEQLYIYYDDKDQVLRVSELEREEHVLKIRRSEATVKTMSGQDGEALRVTLEVVWIGIEFDV